jgi:ubiquinone/menaquinone biosynthesis C-methylase UbiE
MNSIFQCPKCKTKLNHSRCPSCSHVFFNNDGYYDFSVNSSLSMITSETKLSNLLLQIRSHGYSKGLSQFRKNYPKLEHRFDVREGNIAFRAIRQKNTRCLVVNSDLGNIPESLSQIFDEIYSLDADKEKILIQKFRFQEKNLNNIILIKSDVISLPFPDNYFDLVVSYGIKIHKKNINLNKITVLKYFKEIKRVLTSDGCLCAGLGNKYGFKKFSREIGYDVRDETYSDSFYGFSSILNSVGFKVKPYWVLPSYQKIHYSGSLIDGVSLKWFFRNLDIFLPITLKFGIDKLLKKSNIILSKLIMKIFAPTFLFYCYNKKIPKTFEDMIVEKTGFANLIQLVRPRKIMYILFDKLGTPEKKLFCKISKYDLTEKITPMKRTFSNMKDSDEQIVIEDWAGGSVLNPYNKNDINLVMKWLINFQNNSSSELLSRDEIEEEIFNMKNYFDITEEMSDLSYSKWLDEYKHQISHLNLKKTGVHNNLRPNHIYVDHNNSKINVIDWEDFQSKGNPLFDFMWFTITIMMWSVDSKKEFSSNLDGTGKATSIIKIIKKNMDIHFQTNFNFIILLRFFILKWIFYKSKRSSKVDLLYIDFLKLLSDKKMIDI